MDDLANVDNPVTLEALQTKMLRGLRVVLFALMAGGMMFAGVVFVLNSVRQPPARPIPFIAFICVGGFAMGMILSLAVPYFMDRVNRRQLTTPERIVQGYANRTLVGAAILEGTAQFCMVLSIMSHNMSFLILGAAAVLLILMKFPTRSRFDDWQHRNDASASLSTNSTHSIASTGDQVFRLEE